MINFDAVIFDLDGVITRTAGVHAMAWKRMFDEYLMLRSKKHGEPFIEFTTAGDYLPYVDGKPRYKGVASFLESRGISIPFGDPSDLPETETVCGLGNRKNDMFNLVLDETGAEVFDTSVDLIRNLKKAGARVGVASSSKNCKTVLEKVDLLHLFETRIDGVVSAEIGLKGKPEADIFTTACDRLESKYSRSVVVEDAVSGVQAGRNGNFGLVIGVAREDNRAELLQNGADIVVEDLGEITVDTIIEWFSEGMEKDSWKLVYHDYDITKEKSREALLSVGNGYFGTRGSLPECVRNSNNGPGTYVSGLFNRLTSLVNDRKIVNEDMVDIINWIPVTFRIGKGEWMKFDPEPSQKILSIRRELNLRFGELVTEMVLEDEKGRKTRVASSRFAGMHNKNRAGLRYSVTPLNYDGEIAIKSELRGDHRNSGVERYSSLEQEHLQHVTAKAKDGENLLVVKTVTSGIEIATGAVNTIDRKSSEYAITGTSGEGWTSSEFVLNAEQGKTVTLEKIISIYTGLDKGITSPTDEVLRDIASAGTYSSEALKSNSGWERLWERTSITIDGDREAQRIIRLHTYHTMATASPLIADLDTAIPPRGLTGEAYRGHIFWDELFILPFLSIHFPEITKASLMYRYRRLEEARKYAAANGYTGAMFPWQSGSSGREETQVMHLNPLSGEWGEDYSALQRHISLAIAYNLINYFHNTVDIQFMKDYGMELLFDICTFWSSKCRHEEETGRYHIDRVMGPDEYHEKLPGEKEGGLTDNAYTNIMVAWMMDRALSIIAGLPAEDITRTMKSLGLDDGDTDRWQSISRGLTLNISGDGIVEQFRGYFNLPELEWELYLEKYGDIHRLDRILKAERKSPDGYKVAKQADFLMAFFNLGENEVKRIIAGMGYGVDDNLLVRNFNYYLARTSHGSTLSRLVHSALAYRSGIKSEGWTLYMEALRSDLDDIQGGTTGEGIHCGVMTGTVYMVLSVFCGLDLSGNIPVLCPDLPDQWEKVRFNFNFREINYKIDLDHSRIDIFASGRGNQKIKINICGDDYEFEEGKQFSMEC